MRSMQESYRSALQRPAKPAQPAKLKSPEKVGVVMREFKAGKLHSGSDSGPKVSDPKQALAIGLSEARKGS